MISSNSDAQGYKPARLKIETWQVGYFMSRKALLFTVALALLCIIFASVAAVSQAAAAAKISGKVVSTNNMPVQNAAVYLYDDSGKAVQGPANPVMTNASGYYSFDVAGPGNYSLEASKNFYNSTATVPVGAGGYVGNIMLPVDASKLK